MQPAPGLASMTGFARSDGAHHGERWVWELRSVNGRGLEFRVRLPSGSDGIEGALREATQKRLRRGNVNATLTLSKDALGRTPPVLDEAAFERVLGIAQAAAERIAGTPPVRIELLLALPGVLRTEVAPAEDEAARAEREAALLAGFETALAALDASRRAEGARIGAVLAARVDDIARLVAEAEAESAAQPEAVRARVMASLDRLLAGDGVAIQPERIAAEIALLATRHDVREELDRLAGHVEAARALLAEAIAVGRKLDFLVQEFVREANTLCSKAATQALTTIGLALKASIEQMREQVQNVE